MKDLNYLVLFTLDACSGYRLLHLNIIPHFSIGMTVFPLGLCYAAKMFMQGTLAVSHCH